MRLPAPQREAAGAAHACLECSGPRCRARLDDLVRHFSKVYGCPEAASEIASAIVKALPVWFWD